MLRNAIKWLQANEPAREAACSSVWVYLDGKAPPDAIAANPAILVHFAKALVIEAVRQDAPDSAVDELLGMARRMAAGVKELHRYEYAAGVLSQMQGLRDRHEIEPVLERALAGAPDSANRKKLDAMLDVLRRGPTIQDVMNSGETVDEAAFGNWCWTCCQGGCLWCVAPSDPLVTCSLCCVAGCLSCELF